MGMAGGSGIIISGGNGITVVACRGITGGFALLAPPSRLHLPCSSRSWFGSKLNFTSCSAISSRLDVSVSGSGELEVKRDDLGPPEVTLVQGLGDRPQAAHSGG